METIPLIFKFNPNYIGKIPQNQIIWDDITVELFEGTNLVESQKNDFKVYTSLTSTGMRTSANFATPSDGKISGDSGIVRLDFLNNNREWLYLDESYENIMYVDIPNDLDWDYKSSRYNFRKNTVRIEKNETFTRYIYPFSDVRADFNTWESGGDKNRVLMPLFSL